MPKFKCSSIVKVCVFLSLAVGCTGTAVAALAPGNVCTASTTTGLYSGYGYCSTIVNGITRAFVLHIPANYVVGNPLIIGLHPAHSSGLTFQATTGYSSTGNTEGFISVFPNGGQQLTCTNSLGAKYTCYTWNATNNPLLPDDKAFLATLITNIQKRLQTNPKRTHVVGFSAGGYMANNIAANHPALIASIGIVEGSIYSPLTPAVPAAPVATLIFEGSEDTTVPECGIYSSGSDDLLFSYWSAANKATTVVPNLLLCLTGAPSNVTHKIAYGIGSNTVVEFYKLFNTGHAWVRNDLSIPSGSLPWNPNVTVGATEPNLILNFFYAHPKP